MDKTTKQVGIALTISMMVVLGGVIYGITTSPSGGLRTGSTRPTTAPSGICGKNTAVMALNGSDYCAFDVSDDTVVQNPGYAYFRNGSVHLMGVKFQTISPSNHAGDAGSAHWNQSATTVLAAAIRSNMTFPNRSAETSGAVIRDSEQVVILSVHSSPRAGMLVQYSASAYKTYLLVSYPVG